jgi:hypothetical protein
LPLLLQVQEASPLGRSTQPVPTPTQHQLPPGAGWRRMQQQAPYSPARTACGRPSWQQLLLPSAVSTCTGLGCLDRHARDAHTHAHTRSHMHLPAQTAI